MDFFVLRDGRCAFGLVKEGVDRCGYTCGVVAKAADPCGILGVDGSIR